MEKYIKQLLIICLLFTSCSSSKNTANVEGDFAASRLYPYGKIYYRYKSKPGTNKFRRSFWF